MILRRLGKALKEQNWTSIVVEFVLLVAGVFFGLQAANWNEDRLSAQRGVGFTERLRDDLRLEAWNYEMQIGYYGQVRENAIRAADALSGRISLSDEALIAAAYRATQYNENTRQRTTYDELISTREMHLVTDLALRKLAMEIYSAPNFDLITEEGRASQFRQLFRKRVPHPVQFAVAQACGDRVVPNGSYAAIGTALDYPCTIDLPPADIAEAARLLRDDADTLPLLRLRIADTGTNISQFDAYLPDLRNALRRIAAESP